MNLTCDICGLDKPKSELNPFGPEYPIGNGEYEMVHTIDICNGCKKEMESPFMGGHPDKD